MSEDKKRFKYSNITNPETCDINVLRAEVERLKDMTDQYESQQLALKLFLNSTYGACASKFFYAHNVDVAEAITLQGQDLNHYTENKINEYFRGIFQKDTELHKAMGVNTAMAAQFTIGSGRLTPYPPLTKDECPYLDGDESMTVAGDTDSVARHSMVEICGTTLTIGEWFKIFRRESDPRERFVSKNGSDVIDLRSRIGLETDAVDPNTGEVVRRNVRFISRHKVKKEKWKITAKTGERVIVTGDHSVMVYRAGKVISVKASEINPETDKLLVRKKEMKTNYELYKER